MIGTMEMKAKVAIIALASAVLSIICVMPAFAAINPSDFESGSGTETDPYIIANASQLESFRDSVNSGNTYSGLYVKLSNDIDISGQQWTPIASAKRSGSGVASGSNTFAGTFDGANHTVSGLTITPTRTQSEDPDYALGLFGAVMGGTVENLTLSDVKIKCSLSGLAGGAVGLLGDNGTVDNVSVSGSVIAKQGIGGIVGRMVANGTISNCTNNAIVTGTTGTGNIGGIVGAAYYTPEASYMAITNCTNNAAITGTNDVGGIAGLCCAFVSGCTNNGPISSTSYAEGGIAGEQKCYGSITKCKNTAEITNTSTSSPYGVGGIVGWVRYNGAAPSYALCGEIAIAENNNSGAVKTDSAIGVGGIVGVLYSSGEVTGNENTAQTLTGKQFIAGIVGDLQDQGVATLPASIKEGASVINNVSTTKLTNMTGNLADEYAYNNDQSIFVVRDNGDAWVATDESTGDTKYAYLELAISNAVDGDTVKLIADSENNAVLEPAESHNITINLNGHDIGFSSEGGITAAGETITIIGEGNLYAANSDGTIIEGASLLKSESGIDGTEGKIVLKGGTYPTDVSEYVASGYKISTLSNPNEFGNEYEVAADPAESTDESGESGTTTPDDTNATTPTTPGAATTPSEGTHTGDSNDSGASNSNSGTGATHETHSTDNNASSSANSNAGNSTGDNNSSSGIANHNVQGNGSRVAGRLNATSDSFGDMVPWIAGASIISLMAAIACAMIASRRAK